MTTHADEQQGKGPRSSSGEQPSRRVPDGELGRFEPVSDGLILAAVQRAERHRQRENEGVPLSFITEHLGFVYGSWTTRRLRPQLDALMAGGLLVRSRRHGIVVLGLTSSGRRWLARGLRAGEVGVLPESPQHRVWRHARSAAAERIEEFREQVRRALEDAGGLLEGEQTGSDAWFGVAERLRSACRHFGSATYCLREWCEPDDADADVDEQHEAGDELLARDERGRVRSHRQGRRGVWRWPDADPQR
jgi:hypothetical protein